MDNELHGGVSRRTAIKSVAAGTALVWAAPAITSVGASAFAQTSPNPACPTEEWTCSDAPVFCGEGGPFDSCLCDVTVEGDVFCWQDTFCSDVQTCTTSADCPSGSACFTSCCFENKCLAGCAEPFGMSLTESGPRASGA